MSNRYYQMDSYSYAEQHIQEAEELREKYGDAFDNIKALFLNLNSARLNRLMVQYGSIYGSSAEVYARKTYSKWKNGTVTMAGQTMVRLFDLLPHLMSPKEKIELIRDLRSQTLKRLHKLSVSLKLTHTSDVSTIINQIMGMVKRVSEIELPADFREVQGWISNRDAQAISLLLKETESYIAVQRLAELAVHLSTVARLSSLALLGLRLKVTTRFEIPTASIEIIFTPAFWRRGDKAMENDDTDFLVRLQDMALREDYQSGSLTFVDYVMRTLTPAEQQKLRAIAAEEGVKIEVMLKELQVKTVAARGDIDSVIATAADLKAKGHKGRISSEHQTASGVTRIEIENKSGCARMFGVLLLFVLIPCAAHSFGSTYHHQKAPVYREGRSVKAVSPQMWTPVPRGR